MFRYRVIGFLLLIALLAGIFFGGLWGRWLFLAVAPLFTALAFYECAAMLHRSAWPNFPRAVALFFYLVLLSFLLCLTLPPFLEPDPSLRLIPLLLLRLAFFLILLLPLAGCALLLTKREEILSKVLHSLGILFLLGPSLGLFLASYYYRQAPMGAWLLFLCLVTKATDTGGYIVGTLTARLPCGNHKIAPSISPKKSWEGLIGGVILSFAVSLLFFALSPHAPLWWYLLSAPVLSLGSFFGDLTESAVKRLAGVKDSGRWVPGMGGAFDVLDSFLFNGILFLGLILLR